MGGSGAPMIGYQIVLRTIASILGVGILLRAVVIEELGRLYSVATYVVIVDLIITFSRYLFRERVRCFFIVNMLLISIIVLNIL